jgi:hypothetical protein
MVNGADKNIYHFPYAIFHLPFALLDLPSPTRTANEKFKMVYGKW